MTIDWRLMKTDYILRPATADDFSRIRGLIRSVKINPTGLDWQRFIVAMTPQSKLIGCGQVKPHGDGTLELSSIAVIPERRGQGIARAIIERLLSEYPGKLYLTCRSGLAPLYEKFGFIPEESSEMPPYFRRMLKIAIAFRMFFPKSEHLLVMKKN